MNEVKSSNGLTIYGEGNALRIDAGKKQLGALAWLVCLMTLSNAPNWWDITVWKCCYSG
jgi:hypothetical protein